MKLLSLAKDQPRAKLSSDIGFVGDVGLIVGLRPVDLNDDKIPLPDGLEKQTRKVFQNLDVLLAEVGLTRDHVFAVRVFLIDFERLIEPLNVVYAQFFSGPHMPLRTCVGVTALERGALVEMEFTLHKN